MNRAIILLAFSLAAFHLISCNPTNDKGEDIDTKCQKEHGVAEMDFKKILSSSESKNIPRNIKCYTKCLLEKQGVVDKDGESYKKIFVPKLKLNENQLKSLDECINKLKGIADACEYGFQIISCLDQLNP